jgi:hypothetical protein
VDLAGAAPATKAVIGEVSRVDEPRKLVSYLGQRGAPRYVRCDAGIVLVKIMQASWCQLQAVQALLRA